LGQQFVFASLLFKRARIASIGAFNREAPGARSKT
jgi:hypothetical protein